MATKKSPPPTLSNDALVRFILKMLLHMNPELTEECINIRVFNNAAPAPAWSLEIDTDNDDNKILEEDSISLDALFHKAALKLRRTLVARSEEAEKILQETAIILGES